MRPSQSLYAAVEDFGIGGQICRFTSTLRHKALYQIKDVANAVVELCNQKLLFICISLSRFIRFVSQLQYNLDQRDT